MTDKTITVRIKDVYGVAKVYPVCETAQLFAALTGTTTLRPQDLEIIKKLGYTATIQQRELA
jgi:hypothetical protein